ncbi:hypothetical protein [Vibrio furnissii]|uniref:hypothetical protein n=1 Tax=Vibrio furnissii TaxID=29494 RepID=UPI0011216A93|nr:hypothetical protein [Vibrio furnissii]QDC95017.1 hypothetical protein FIU11_20135 [Vibrio furnissii]UON50455.1 hypothetical protein IUJ52_15770 [Vibrio furnissii]
MPSLKPENQGKNSGRIFRFSASGTPKTGPANTKEPTGTFWLLFVPAKSNWRAHTMRRKTTEPTSVTIHHLQSQKKKASAMLAFSLENNWITVAA